MDAQCDKLDKGSLSGCVRARVVVVCPGEREPAALPALRRRHNRRPRRDGAVHRRDVPLPADAVRQRGGGARLPRRLLAILLLRQGPPCQWRRTQNRGEAGGRELSPLRQGLGLCVGVYVLGPNVLHSDFCRHKPGHMDLLGE